MYPLGVSNCQYLVFPKQSLFLLVAGCHFISLKGFHKPTSILFFSLLFFLQLCSILLARMLAKFIGVSSCHSLFILFFRMSQFLFYCFEGIVLLLFWVNLVVLSRSWCSLALFTCLLCLLSDSFSLSNCFCPIFLPKCCQNFP